MLTPPLKSPRSHYYSDISEKPETVATLSEKKRALFKWEMEGGIDEHRAEAARRILVAYQEKTPSLDFSDLHLTSLPGNFLPATLDSLNLSGCQIRELSD
jgi:hypothetical protein